MNVLCNLVCAFAVVFVIVLVLVVGACAAESKDECEHEFGKWEAEEGCWRGKFDVTVMCRTCSKCGWMQAEHIEVLR